jgi:hypothetical protein
MSAVADLLTASRAAHQSARALLAKGQAADELLREALDRRMEARRADPDRVDPAWLEDALHPKMPGEPRRRYHRVPGQSIEAIARSKDQELVAYYLEKLDPASTEPPAPLSDRELLEKVIPPQAWQTDVAGITACTCGHAAALHRGKLRRCTVQIADGQVCDCPGYTATPCDHRWKTDDTRRVCLECDEQQQLVATKAPEDTEAFKQLQREQRR